jgi:hypothetical protein
MVFWNGPNGAGIQWLLSQCNQCAGAMHHRPCGNVHTQRATKSRVEASATSIPRWLPASISLPRYSVKLVLHMQLLPGVLDVANWVEEKGGAHPFCSRQHGPDYPDHIFLSIQRFIMKNSRNSFVHLLTLLLACLLVSAGAMAEKPDWSEGGKHGKYKQNH